ncbi:alpha/beta fold hydrolase [Patescibacteria group bacterium]|nr:alpha/beta fold hydrolase [Patescibacteria group bacterium]
MIEEYEFKKIEEKWQKKWDKEKVFEARELNKKKKFFLLEMYPYPSGSGLHMGHAFNYTIGDIYARFKRMQGFNVLYPMGYDSFGLPAENAAIKEKTHPKKYTENSISNFINQQKALGLSYDWSRILWSHNPEYYKWNQLFFLKFLEKGLVYRKKSPVNWCSKCNTVLANEQVRDGKCWRHGDVDIEIKNLEQWFLKTTNYADELLNNLDSLDWPEKIKVMQKNWIGKSKGVEINFEIRNPDKKPKLMIVHGWGGSPKENWFNWIREKYKDKYEIITPNLPNSSNPEIESWYSELEKYKDKLDSDTIVIGYSLGGPTICKFLERNKIKIKKLIMIAPSSPNYTKEHLDWIKKLDALPEEINSLKNYLQRLNLNLNNLKSLLGETIIYLSKDDPHIWDFDKRLEEYTILSPKFKIFENKGHFNSDFGITKIPELEEDLINSWPIFTTRPDTIFGVTFMVISAQHPKLENFITSNQKKEVNNFLKKITTTSEKNSEDLIKEGAFTGSFAKNPLTGEEVPIYVGNFVVSDYGSGMVMSVPAHDQRDFDFAKKYNIPIKTVINPPEGPLRNEGKSSKDLKEAYCGKGILINSGEFSGMNSLEALKKISDKLEIEGKGKRCVQYKMRDWLVSRQRYWGTPIPVIYCEHCGIVPVPEKDLPVLLPEKIKFGEGNPLQTNSDFINVKCPKCNLNAIRETDTMDTFFDSSWYYLRFCDNKNKKEPFDKKKVDFWMPVDQYIGGAEHACMHLIYARFFTKALRDLNFLKIDEPFKKLFNQGMLYGLDGFVMSKSRGNVVLPEEVSKKYGIDTARIFLVSLASPDKDIQWSEKGINGSLKFIKRIITYFEKNKSKKEKNIDVNPKTQHKIHQTLKFVTEDIENFRYNFAIIKIRKLFEQIFDLNLSKKDSEILLKILNPFCPHITEEIWHRIGNKSFLSLEKWPKFDENKIDKKFEKEDEIIEKLILDLNNIIKIFEDKKTKLSSLYLYCIPSEKEIYLNNLLDLENRFDLKIKIFSVNEKEIYDPENKSKKVKPGKPGIYLE